MANYAEENYASDEEFCGRCKTSDGKFTMSHVQPQAHDGQEIRTITVTLEVSKATQRSARSETEPE